MHFCQYKNYKNSSGIRLEPPIEASSRSAVSNCGYLSSFCDEMTGAAAKPISHLVLKQSDAWLNWRLRSRRSQTPIADVGQSCETVGRTRIRAFVNGIRDKRECSSRSHVSSAVRRGALCSWRTCRRSSALRPLSRLDVEQYFNPLARRFATGSASVPRSDRCLRDGNRPRFSG